jgi:hypothetical protein
MRDELIPSRHRKVPPVTELQKRRPKDGRYAQDGCGGVALRGKGKFLPTKSDLDKRGEKPLFISSERLSFRKLCTAVLGFA